MKFLFWHRIQSVFAWTVILSMAMQSAGLTNVMQPNIAIRHNPTFLKSLYSDDQLSDYGEVEDVFIGNNSRHQIILIQDAHMNASAQQNISKLMLKIHEKNPQFNRAFLEAGFGEESVSDIQVYLDSVHRERQVQSLLHKGLIQGVEAFALLADQPIQLSGIESADLYNESLRVFLGVKNQLRETELHRINLQNALEKISMQIMNPRLRGFYHFYHQYELNELSLTQYCELLDSELSSSGENENPELNSIQKLSRLKKLEATIDFDQANLELQNAVLFKESDQTPTKQLIRVNAGNLNLLRQFIKELNVEELSRTGKAFPELEKYHAYLSEINTLKIEEVMSAIRIAEQIVFMRLIQTDAESELIQYVKYLNQTERLMRLSADSATVEKWRALSRRMTPESLGAWINRKLIDQDIGAEYAIIMMPKFQELLAKSVRFYDLAVMREDYFMHQMERLFDRDSQKGFLIIGGYHSERMKSLMRRNNISFASIKPHVRHETDTQKYTAILESQSRTIDSRSTENIGFSASDMLMTLRHGLNPTLFQEIKMVLTGSSESVAARLAESPVLKARRDRLESKLREKPPGDHSQWTAPLLIQELKEKKHVVYNDIRARGLQNHPNLDYKENEVPSFDEIDERRLKLKRKLEERAPEGYEKWTPKLLALALEEDLQTLQNDLYAGKYRGHWNLKLEGADQNPTKSEVRTQTKRIEQALNSNPPDGFEFWTNALLADELKIPSGVINRYIKRGNLRSHPNYRLNHSTAPKTVVREELELRDNIGSEGARLSEIQNFLTEQAVELSTQLQSARKDLVDYLLHRGNTVDGIRKLDEILSHYQNIVIEIGAGRTNVAAQIAFANSDVGVIAIDPYNDPTYTVYEKMWNEGRLTLQEQPLPNAVVLRGDASLLDLLPLNYPTDVLMVNYEERAFRHTINILKRIKGNSDRRAIRSLYLKPHSRAYFTTSDDNDNPTYFIAGKILFSRFGQNYRGVDLHQASDFRQKTRHVYVHHLNNTHKSGARLSDSGDVNNEIRSRILMQVNDLRDSENQLTFRGLVSENLNRSIAGLSSMHVELLDTAYRSLRFDVYDTGLAEWRYALQIATSNLGVVVDQTSESSDIHQDLMRILDHLIQTLELANLQIDVGGQPDTDFNNTYLTRDMESFTDRMHGKEIRPSINPGIWYLEQEVEDYLSQLNEIEDPDINLFIPREVSDLWSSLTGKDVASELNVIMREIRSIYNLPDSAIQILRFGGNEVGIRVDPLAYPTFRESVVEVVTAVVMRLEEFFKPTGISLKEEYPNFDVKTDSEEALIIDYKKISSARLAGDDFKAEDRLRMQLLFQKMEKMPFLQKGVTLHDLVFLHKASFSGEVNDLIRRAFDVIPDTSSSSLDLLISGVRESSRILNQANQQVDEEGTEEKYKQILNDIFEDVTRIYRGLVQVRIARLEGLESEQWERFEDEIDQYMVVWPDSPSVEIILGESLMNDLYATDAEDADAFEVSIEKLAFDIRSGQGMPEEQIMVMWEDRQITGLLYRSPSWGQNFFSDVARRIVSGLIESVAEVVQVNQQTLELDIYLDEAQKLNIHLKRRSEQVGARLSSQFGPDTDWISQAPSFSELSFDEFIERAFKDTSSGLNIVDIGGEPNLFLSRTLGLNTNGLWAEAFALEEQSLYRREQNSSSMSSDGTFYKFDYVEGMKPALELAKELSMDTKFDVVVMNAPITAIPNIAKQFADEAEMLAREGSALILVRYHANDYRVGAEQNLQKELIQRKFRLLRIIHWDEKPYNYRHTKFISGPEPIHVYTNVPIDTPTTTASRLSFAADLQLSLSHDEQEFIAGIQKKHEGSFEIPLESKGTKQINILEVSTDDEVIRVVLRGVNSKITFSKQVNTQSGLVKEKESELRSLNRHRESVYRRIEQVSTVADWLSKIPPIGIMLNDLSVHMEDDEEFESVIHYIFAHFAGGDHIVLSDFNELSVSRQAIVRKLFNERAKILQDLRLNFDAQDTFYVQMHFLSPERDMISNNQKNSIAVPVLGFHDRTSIANLPAAFYSVRSVGAVYKQHADRNGGILPDVKSVAHASLLTDIAQNGGYKIYQTYSSVKSSGEFDRLVRGDYGALWVKKAMRPLIRFTYAFRQIILGIRQTAISA